RRPRSCRSRACRRTCATCFAWRASPGAIPRCVPAGRRTAPSRSDRGVSGRHEPVLVDETLRFLRQGDGWYLDATLGDGGHAKALLDAEPGARVLGCDRDPDAIASAGARLERYGDRVVIAHASFRELPHAHARIGGEPLAGALLDLGVSSRQFDDPGRGMSFRAEGPLDLRMDPTRGESAADWLAGAEASEVADVLRRHGDVRDARGLARHLVAEARAQRLRTTTDLAN